MINKQPMIKQIKSLFRVAGISLLAVKVASVGIQTISKRRQKQTTVLARLRKGLKKGFKKKAKQINKLQGLRRRAGRNLQLRAKTKNNGYGNQLVMTLFNFDIKSSKNG